MQINDSIYMAKWNPMRDGGREWIFLEEENVICREAKSKSKKNKIILKGVRGERFKVASQRIMVDEITIKSFVVMLRLLFGSLLLKFKLY